MSKNIIGFGGYDTESSAVLLKDGKLIAAAQEERFSRQKHVGGFPYNAIRFCLKEANFDVSSVDSFAYPFKQDYKFYIKNTLSNLYLNLPSILKNPKIFQNTLCYRIHRFNTFHGELKRVFVYQTKIPYEKIKFHDHHKCHFASAYCTSGFDDAIGLTIDLEGDGKSVCGWRGSGNKITKILDIPYPDSLGLFYNRFTQYLGFKTHDEYKVMGLAAYGKPTFLSELKEILFLTENGLTLSKKYFHPIKSHLFSEKIYDLLGPGYEDHDQVDERQTDIACSIQVAFEEALVHLCKIIKTKTGVKNLILAGGCSLNSKANGVLLNKKMFNNIYIPASAGDHGVALGAAYLEHMQQGSSFPLKRLVVDSWGPSYSNADIKNQLEKSKINYHHLDSPSKEVAQILSDGKIIGWFQGRMEFGPRALGNRSILADPRDGKMKDKINQAIKFREQFRPFAPICTEESSKEYFCIEADAPFMTFTVDVREEKKSEIPAIVHHDGTARLQTVSLNNNPALYNLLKEFEKITNIPVLVNTSFNVAGEPIVCTPNDAIKTFFSSGLDGLVLENYLILK